MKAEERSRKTAKEGREALRQRKARDDARRLHLLGGLLRQSEGYMRPGWWVR